MLELSWKIGSFQLIHQGIVGKRVSGHSSGWVICRVAFVCGVLLDLGVASFFRLRGLGPA